MESLSMDVNSNMTLFEYSAQILNELRSANIHLRQMMIYQQQTVEKLEELNTLVTGFTNGGASLTGYIPDAFVAAYVAVLGPALAKRLDTPDIGLEELMKGGTLLARTLLEELSAYRSEQEGRDVLAEVLANTEDPWEEPTETDPSDYRRL